jgi:hypothetical protein
MGMTALIHFLEGNSNLGDVVLHAKFPHRADLSHR